MEAFKNCKEVKHIMIIDYDFLSYVIFDQQMKITFRKASGTPSKVHLPPKNSKSVSPLFFSKIENFLAPPAERGGGHCGCFMVSRDVFVLLFACNTVLKLFCPSFFVN